MNSQDQLFELIRSLSKNEKGYFKVFASREEKESNYLRLFEAIDKQARGSLGEYNEKKIVGQFKGEKFTKQFPVAKNYLLNLILKSLRNYHAESLVDMQLTILFQNATVLYSKMLYKQSVKTIAQAEKLALENEKFEFLIMLKELEKRVAERVDKNIADVIESQELVFKKSINLQEYLLLYKETIPLMGPKVIRDAESKSKYEKVLQHSSMKDEDKPQSYRALYFYHSIRGRYHAYIGDFDQAYVHFKKRLELARLNASKKWTDNYLTSLGGMMGLCLRQEKYDELKDLIHEMRISKFEKSENTEVEIFVRSYSMEVFLNIETGKSVNAISLIPVVENGIKKFNNKISASDALTFYLTFAYSYFETGSYKEAIQWINKIVNSSNSAQRPDIQCASRIINILIHYELRNEELLRYVTVSAYRFLYKKNRLYKFEKTLLNYIRKSVNINTEGARIESFKILHTELSELIKDPFEKMVMQSFPYFSWLESKIYHKPFAEVVKERKRKGLGG